MTDPDIRKHVLYDPSTGHFTRLTHSARCPAGSRTGTYDRHGYQVIIVNGKKYLGHRLGWYLTYGKWPDKHLDHINGVTGDNRLENLREATPQQNLQNTLSNPNRSRSGLIGAHWAKDKQKWYSQIQAFGVHYHLGYHPTKEHAHAAYLEAKKNLHTFNPELRAA